MRSRFLAAAVLAVLAASPAVALDTPPGIGTKRQGDGWLLADDKGMTLYTYDRDEGAPGKSTCNEDCALTWPPLLASADAKPMKHWSIIVRDDGAAQWAFQGKPLYRYTQDAFPGGTFGDGVGEVWRVAFQPIALPGEMRMGSTRLGRVLTDAKGGTLYARADAPGDPAKCDAACMKTWQPIVAPAMARAFDDFTIVVHASGLRQWAYQGKALYRYAQDVNPGETAGHDVGPWRAVVLEPAPPLPPWATVQASDAGELIANKDGLTVYSHAYNPRNRRAFRTPGCEGECVDTVQWVPFLADADAKSLGSWAILDLPDGKRQWTYKGMKLYTNIHDKGPGDFKGIRFGGDRAFAAIMRNGQPMQGVSVGG
jgi:predicted lipoprotein with Yx(FWY)xxD motif